MIHLQNDYLQGAHPKILQALIDTNTVPMSGYGSDPFSLNAVKKIKHACDLPNGQVFLLSGGTQVNKIVISTMLRPYQGVISAETGHIAIHEAGAIEASGHKVIALDHNLGKISAQQVEQFLASFHSDPNKEHMVMPGMVYVSQPTEYGTLYSYDELKNISTVCKQYQIPLFVDGARLIYALGSDQNNLSLADLAQLADVFYIGGTKAGTLIGEAVVFTKNNQPPHFLSQVKQSGALLAKGRLLGIQFDTLFTEDLYMEIGKQAIKNAQKLKIILQEKGYDLYLDSPTNQVFIQIPTDKYEKFSAVVSASPWEPPKNGQIILRLATSWSTTDADMQALAENLPPF